MVFLTKLRNMGLMPMETLDTYVKLCKQMGTLPMDPSTFLGSVWGIIYYNLEA